MNHRLLLPSLIFALALTLAVARPAQAAPEIIVKDWINGACPKTKILVCWFGEILVDENCGVDSVNAAYEKLKHDPNVGIVMLTSGGIGAMQSWVAAHQVNFPVGCSASPRCLKSFAVQSWPAVRIIGPKGDVAWSGSPDGILAAVEKIQTDFQTEQLPKIQKAVSKIPALAKDGNYAKAYAEYWEAYQQVWRLEYAKTLQQEMQYLEDKVVAQYDGAVFAGKAKNAASQIQQTIEKIKGTPLQARLEQRLRIVKAGLEDPDTLLWLQLAHLNRLTAAAAFDQAYAGLTQIATAVQASEENAAMVADALQRIEKMVANRVRFLVKNRDSSFDASIQSLCAYFANTPMPDKIKQWAVATEQLAAVVKQEAEETKKPESATSFEAAKETDYSTIAFDQLVSDADVLLTRGRSLIEDLSGDNPQFDQILNDAKSAFMKASQMYAAAITKTEGPITTLQEKLRESRKQLFFCHKMARN